MYPCQNWIWVQCYSYKINRKIIHSTTLNINWSLILEPNYTCHTVNKRRQKHFSDAGFRLRSQNPRRAEASTDLRAHLLPSLLQQGYQGHVQPSFGDLEGENPTTPGQPVPGLHHLHSTEMLPNGQKEHPVLQFAPTISCPGTVLSAPSP